MSVGSGTGNLITTTVYGTVARLRAEHLTQVAAGATNDALLLQMLSSATAIVNEALSFALTGYAAAAARTFYREASRRLLRLPYYEAGTLTALALDETVIDLTDTDYIFEWDDHTALAYAGGWAAGYYTATAKWGYGGAPEAIITVTLQLAVDLWNGRDARSSANTVNVEGAGAAPVSRSFTWQQWQILQSVRRTYGQTGVA